MISEKRRKELEASGKIKPGKVRVLKKGKKIEPPRKNEMAEIAKKMDATLESVQKQNLQIFGKLSESLDAIQNKKADIPRDKDLTEIVKNLPGIIKEINDTANKRYALLFKDLIQIVKTENKPVVMEKQEKPPKKHWQITETPNKDGKKTYDLREI